jgi:sarcosine oxidase subunit gamma
MRPHPEVRGDSRASEDEVAITQRSPRRGESGRGVRRNMTLAPQSLLRRSFIYRELAGLGARFEAVNGMAAPIDFGQADAELSAARRLAIADCSALPRTGYKGPRALDWLRGQGVAIGDHDNLSYWQPEDALAARLAPSEALVLGPLSGEAGLCARLDGTWSIGLRSGAYRVPRADTNCWFRISGAEAPVMFAKVCGVDLRPSKFEPGAIAQTSVAKLTAIVIRADLGDIPAYHLLTDSASAKFMWSSLIDAMSEFAGQPVGLAALRKLAGV